MERNTFADNTIHADSSFLVIENAKKVIFKDNIFSNITYDTDGTASTLIDVEKNVLETIEIDGVTYEDSNINFINLDGLSPVNATYSLLSMNKISIQNIIFERSSVLIQIGDFLSELEIQTSLKNS